MARRGENIRKRKDGRWEGRYILRQENEKSKMCSVYARSYREVKQKLAEARRDAAKSEWPKSRGEEILFTDMAEEWFSYVAESKKYSTYVKYRQVYDRYLSDFFQGQRISGITSETVETKLIPRILSKSGLNELSKSLVKSICCVINQILIYASKRQHIIVNTIQIECRKTPQKPVQVFHTLEQQKLIRFLKMDMDLYKFGIILCLYTGLRIGELCALKWTDIDMKNRIIRVTSTVQRLPVLTPVSGGKKTVLMITAPKSFCSRREIPICDELYSLLLEFCHEDKYVIGKTKPADPRTYQKKYRAYLRDAGIEYRCFHTLRHTFASNCAACGMDAKALSEILGHAGVQITLNRYVHPSMHTKREYLNLLAGV